MEPLSFQAGLSAAASVAWRLNILSEATSSLRAGKGARVRIFSIIESACARLLPLRGLPGLPGSIVVL